MNNLNKTADERTQKQILEESVNTMYLYVHYVYSPHGGTLDYRHRSAAST